MEKWQEQGSRLIYAAGKAHLWLSPVFGPINDWKCIMSGTRRLTKPASNRACPASIPYKQYGQSRTGCSASHLSTSELPADQISQEECVMTPVFVLITDLAGMRAAGITYPSTVDGFRWLFRRRHERGMDDAFRRVGRRILLDTARYIELVRSPRRSDAPGRQGFRRQS